MTVILDDMRESDVPDVLAFEAGARVHEELARPWARIRVARDEAGRVVAFLVAWLVVDELHVLDVFVCEGRRREGLGRALLDDALVHGRSRGARNVYLEVRRSNEPAIRLYKSSGFAEHNVRKAYYPDGEDALEMARSLE